MSTLTVKEHVERAAAFVGLIKKHEADLSAIGSDVPKAISIAQDFHDLFNPPASPAQPLPRPTVADLQKILDGPDDHDVHINPDGSVTAKPKPAAAPAAPRVTAAHAAQHIKERGLTEAERMAFERASG